MQDVPKNKTVIRMQTENLFATDGRVKKVLGQPKDYSKQVISRLWFLRQQARALNLPQENGSRIRRIIAAAQPKSS